MLDAAISCQSYHSYSVLNKEPGGLFEKFEIERRSLRLHGHDSSGQCGFSGIVDSPALLINGVEDHIHGLVSLSRKFSIMKVIQEAKTETSKWLKRQSPKLGGFAWQSGYGVFSVSESNIPRVRAYIEAQEAHHQKMTFQDEFAELCRRHHINIDERYVWD